MPAVRNFMRRVASEAQIVKAFAAEFGHVLTRGPAAVAPTPLAPGGLRIWAHNVNLYFDDEVMLKLRGFIADLQPFDTEHPLRPDLKDSFQLLIHAGQIRIPADSLEALLNRYILPPLGHPLRDARLTISGDRLGLRGKIHRLGMNLPVSMEAVVSLDAAGMMRLATDRLAVSQMGVGGLLKMLHMDLERLMELPEGAMMQVEGNSLTLDPAAIFPAPRATGRPTTVTTERGELVLGYEPENPIPTPELVDSEATNYLLGVGHDLQVGKMIIKDAYLQLVNLEPSKHLDFSLERFREQLTGGTSSLLASDHLLVRLPNLPARA